MNFPGNYWISQSDKRRDNRVKRQEKQLLAAHQQGLDQQSAAGQTMFKIAAKQTTALSVGAEQAGYYAQKQLLKYGTTNNPVVLQFAGGPPPPIAPKQKIEMGYQALKATPEVYKAYYLGQQAGKNINKASALEDKVLATKAQQALETDRNMKVVGGEKFYDAFESPEQATQAFAGYTPQKLMPTDFGSPLLQSPRFRQTLEHRYGAPAPQPALPPPLFQGYNANHAHAPQSIGYHSSQGWIDDKKPATSRPSQTQPEDLSWMNDVQHRAIGWKQVASLQARPN